MVDFNPTKLKRELTIDARAIGIPIGSAKVFIERTIESVTKNLAPKSIITEADLKRAVIKELKKYNTDLTYVYQNRDKII